MMLSRTRKEIKAIENFYKEAGLDQEIEGMYKTKPEASSSHKKDRLARKKKEKLETLSRTDTRSTSDKHNSELSDEALREETLTQNAPQEESVINHSFSPELEEIVEKMSIVSVSEHRLVKGTYGHTTVFLKRPIIEGKYYVEFKIVKSVPNAFKAKIKSEPAVRIGICPPDYPKNTPLGQKTSLGFKSSNGKVVNMGVEFEGSESFHEDDVIGLGLSFSPPDKYQKKDELWENCEIKLTKNGRVISTFTNVYQNFYCPAFSLFNYACLEVRFKKESMEYLLEGYKPYESVFQEEILYEDLKSENVFSKIDEHV